MSNPKKPNRWPWIAAIIAVLIAIVFLVYFVIEKLPTPPDGPQTGQSQTKPAEPGQGQTAKAKTDQPKDAKDQAGSAKPAQASRDKKTVQAKPPGVKSGPAASPAPENDKGKFSQRQIGDPHLARMKKAQEEDLLQRPIPPQADKADAEPQPAEPKPTPKPKYKPKPGSYTGKISKIGVPTKHPQGKVVKVVTKLKETKTGTMLAQPDAIMAERKQPFGIKRSLDAVVRTDESIDVKGTVIPVAELERKIVVEQRGEVLEKPLDRPAQVSAWGVYVVRKGDNLWEVHFRLLTDYLKSQGVELDEDADMPQPSGYSSGVGKVLKFAENMVGVYNLKTGKMHHNLDLIEPGEKVVIYNLSEIFEMLSKIDPHDLSGVEYDGRVLFFPKRMN
jgi:hypothetical protein